MTYYDHETNMVLKLGVWSEQQPPERRSWVIEKELAELRTEKPPGLKELISKILKACVPKVP